MSQTDSSFLTFFTVYLIYMILLLLFALGSVVFSVVAYWKIFSKAGYEGAMGLLMLVPFGNLVVICILAFTEWPVHRELRQLREYVARNHPGNFGNPGNAFPGNPGVDPVYRPPQE